MKHTKKREKINNQGLTLIELIVTIAIIGIFGVVVMSFVTSGANFYRQASDRYQQKYQLFCGRTSHAK